MRDDSFTHLRCHLRDLAVGGLQTNLRQSGDARAFRHEVMEDPADADARQLRIVACEEHPGTFREQTEQRVQTGRVQHACLVYDQQSACGERHIRRRTFATGFGDQSALALQHPYQAGNGVSQSWTGGRRGSA